MNKLLILALCMLYPLLIQAQQKSEYNRRGDQAMSSNDYRDAKIWYEEGVANCDEYSIRQLTTIWINNESMRPSMHSVMIKCLNCLTLAANANDTTAISQLIVYYDKGIGTSRSEELRNFYRKQSELLKAPVPQHYPVQNTEQLIPEKAMEWFAGYAYSPKAPYGITVGGIWDKTGWYVRVKTNFSFQHYSYECNNDLTNIIPLPENASVRSNKEGAKRNSYMGTAGFIYKINSWLYGSLGVGYGESALIWPLITTDFSSGEKKNIWSYNTDSSYKGVVLEADMTYRYKSYFVSIGCYTLNFKYADLNAGIGMFF